MSRRVFVLAALQLGAVLALAGYHEYLRATAPRFVIPLAPVDPYDVLRGRYFVLNPLDAAIEARDDGGSTLPASDVAALGVKGSALFSERAWVAFCPSGDLFRVCRIARDRQAAEVGFFWVPAGVRAYHVSKPGPDGEGRAIAPHWKVQLELGLTRYYLPSRLELPARANDPGWQLEVVYRPGQPLLPRRLLFRGEPVWPT